MPAAPTIAAMTASAVGSDATADAPSAPQTISTWRFKRDRSRATSSGFRTDTISGEYISICCASRSRLPPAARPMTRNASGNASTTSSVERPTEPVEPRMEILRMWLRRHDLEASEVVNDQEPVHVKDRRRVENRIESIEEAAVAGDQRAGVFHIGGAFSHRFGEVADHAGDRENHAGDDGVDEREVVEEGEVDDERCGHG